jgi:hypothetical protein
MEDQIYQLKLALEKLIENRSGDVIELLNTLQASVEDNGRRLAILEEHCFGSK